MQYRLRPGFGTIYVQCRKCGSLCAENADAHATGVTFSELSDILAGQGVNLSASNGYPSLLPPSTRCDCDMYFCMQCGWATCCIHPYPRFF